MPPQATVVLFSVPRLAGSLCVAPVLHLKCHCGILSLPSDDIIHTELRRGGAKPQMPPACLNLCILNQRSPASVPSSPPDDSYEKYLAAHLTLSPSLTLQVPPPHQGHGAPSDQSSFVSHLALIFLISGITGIVVTRWSS